MVWKALWSGRLCGQPLLSMDIVWVLPAELSEHLSDNLTLGETESPQVILRWVWCLSQDQTQEQEIAFGALLF